MASLKEKVFDICSTLAGQGWNELLINVTTVPGSLQPPLDIEQASSDALEAELLMPRAVNRSVPGFDDFSNEGEQGITPRFPARSILYHALASPKVLFRDLAGTQKLDQFPSLEQIETVENFVFGIQAPSLSFLESLFPLSSLNVVVFANQYRAAIDVPHQKHADLVFSRTGVARVGTSESKYNADTIFRFTS